MKKCAKCGAEWDSGAAFCGECGAPIDPADREAARQAGPERDGATRTLVDPGGAPAGRKKSETSYSVVDRSRAVAEEPRGRGKREEARTTGANRPTLPKDALSELFSPPQAAQTGGKAGDDVKKPPPPAAGTKAGAATTPQAQQRLPPPTGRGGAGRPAPPPAVPAAAAAPAAPAPAAAPAAAATTGAATPGRRSSRPPRRSSRPPTAEGSIDKLLDELDAGFDSIVQKSDAPSTPGVQRADDVAAVRGLFVQIAADYARPIRDFVLEVRLGDPVRDWLDMCRPALASLARSAQTMELVDLAGAAHAFLAVLDEIAKGTGKNLDADAKRAVTEAYDELVRVQPDVFALDGEASRREPIIVQSLLCSVPDVKKVALDKIYAAGLTRLEMFYVARPGEMSVATGLPLETCVHIAERFAAYKREVESTKLDPSRSMERNKVAELALGIEQKNAEFDRVASRWSDDAATRKKLLRQERETLMLEVQVVLARLGEVDLVSRLERLPFGKKVEELTRWLDEAKRLAKPTP